MLQLNMTYHARTDRLDRLVLCVEKFGIGEFILEYHDTSRHAMRKLTSTGLMLIVGENNELITGYMATVTQIKEIYLCKLNKQPPSWILTQARNNQKRMERYLK